MAREWSHTQEAYDHGHKETLRLPDKDILVILAEWNAHKACNKDYGHDNHSGFDDQVYAGTLTQLEAKRHRLGDQILEAWAEKIWEHAEGLALCDKGGHRFWVCPYGCHTVSAG